MAVQISGNDITVPRDGSFTRNVTIGGTLTYEDVTNIDSVGLVTARNGIEIGTRPGVAASISVDGNMIVSGISTFGGALSGTTGTFSGAVAGTTGTFSGAVSGTTGTFTGDVDIADKIVHTGDTNTAIRFPSADTITAETGGSERLRIESDGDIGLATNSPNATGFASPVTSIGKSGNAYAVLELQGTQTSDGAAGVLVCHNSSGSSRLAELQFNREGANNTGSLSVNTYGSGSAAEVARFNASKQLLIGTTSNRTINSHAPRLQISGTDYSSSTVSIINNTNDGNGAYLFLAKQRSGSAGGSTIVQNGDILGQIRFSGADGVDMENPAAYIEAKVDGSPASNDMPARVSVYTNSGSTGPGERIRIEPQGALTFVGAQLRAGNTNSICSAGNNSLDLNYTEYFYLRTGNSTETFRCNNNGDIMAGRTSPFSSARLSLEKSGTCLGIRQAGNADHNSIEMTHLYATSASYQGFQISFRDASGNQRGSITNNTSTTTYNTSSDYRLKENEVLISDGITRLKTLKPYRFNWKNDTDRRVDGFFAHEVTDAVPEAVIGEKDAPIGEGAKGYQQIDHSKLVPLLTAALQEAVTEIESLKARLDAAGL